MQDIQKGGGGRKRHFLKPTKTKSQRNSPFPVGFFLPFLAKLKYKERQECERLLMKDKISVVLLEV